MDIKALVIRDTDSIPAWASPLPGLWECCCGLLHGKPGSFGEKTGQVNEDGGQSCMDQAQMSSPGASPHGSEYPFQLWGFLPVQGFLKELVVTLGLSRWCCYGSPWNGMDGQMGKQVWGGGKRKAGIPV